MWEIEKLKEYADVYGKAEAVMDAIAAKLRKEPEEAGKMEREMIRVIQETPMRDEYFIFYILSVGIDSAFSARRVCRTAFGRCEQFRAAFPAEQRLYLA